MRHKFRLQAKVGKVLLDLPAHERAKETKSLSLPSINLEDFLRTRGSNPSVIEVVTEARESNLLETAFDEFISGHPDILRGAEVLETNFIFVGLLQLLATEDLVDEPLLTLHHDKSSVFHPLLLLGSDLSAGLCHIFQVLSSLIAPQHVLEWRLVEMVVDVMESVLGDVADNQVGMFPDLPTLVGFHVTIEKLDER